MSDEQERYDTASESGPADIGDKASYADGEEAPSGAGAIFGVRTGAAYQSCTLSMRMLS